MSKPESHRASAPGVPAITVTLLCALLLHACGLGMTTEERLARAEGALAEGETQAAIIDAKNILLDEPDHVEARLLLGRASLAAGDGVAAEKELGRAVELGVPRTDVAVEMARALLLQQKHRRIVDEFDAESVAAGTRRQQMLSVIADSRLALDEPELARQTYQQILTADPEHSAAMLGVAHTYIAERNMLQARESLSRVLEENPDYGRAWLSSGRLHMSARDFESARDDFARAHELASAAGDEPLDMQAVFGLAEASLALDDLEAAARYSGMLDSLAPDSVAALQVAGRVAYATQNWKLAQDKLAEALRRHPADNMARTMLGAVHLQSGNLGQAEMHLSEAVASSPDNVDARRLLAETRVKLNKSSEARLALQPLVDGDDADPRSLAMAARVDLLAGDFESAAEYLERSAAEYPASANVQLDLAVAYLLAGRLEDAQAILDQAPEDDSPDSAFRRDALRLLTKSRSEGLAAALSEGAALSETWPDRPMSHVLHGAMLMSSGDTDAAREAFAAAHELNPEDVTALRYLARVDEVEGKWDAAEERYLAMLETRPEDLHALFALGRIAARNESPEEAIEWLEKARQADPRSIAPRVVLAKLYITERRFADAETVAREGLELNDGVADLHNALGVVELSKRQPGAAVERFARAVELAPDNRDFRTNLARAHTVGGDGEEALATLDEIDGNPLEHLPSGILRANAQIAAGDVDAALATARALREIHEDSAVPIALEAELLAQRGELEEAIRLYDEALAVETSRRVAVSAFNLRRRAGNAEAEQPLVRFLEARPLDTEARILLAQHFHQQDESDRAMAEYRRVLDTAPENFVALNNLAWLYFTDGDARAESIARRAHALAPENGSVLDTLGWILVRKDELDEGIGLLRQAVELTDGAEVRYHLAAALAASGDDGEARRLLEEILSSETPFPSRNEAQTLLASL